MSDHPSYLQLDRLALGAADVATSEHVNACARCRAHLGKLEQPVAVPAWAKELPDRRGGLWERLGAIVTGRRSLAALGALACAAVVLVALPHSEFDTTKGAPSVAVYVKREGRVTLWDGQAALHAGDAVQLKVQPEEFARIALATLEGTEAHELYQAPVAGKSATLLPTSFTLDGAPTTLLVVFSQAPLTAAELTTAARELPRGKSLWATRLELTR